jgi:hypothetical protein
MLGTMYYFMLWKSQEVWIYKIKILLTVEENNHINLLEKTNKSLTTMWRMAGQLGSELWRQPIPLLYKQPVFLKLVEFYVM